VALERLQRCARGGVLEPHRLVVRARHDLLAVRGEGHGPDRERVALERLQRYARGGVPEPHRLVIRARHDLLAVRGEGHGVD
jgi:hypothetical protein